MKNSPCVLLNKRGALFYFLVGVTGDVSPLLWGPAVRPEGIPLGQHWGKPNKFIERSRTRTLCLRQGVNPWH